MTDKIKLLLGGMLCYILDFVFLLLCMYIEMCV